MGGAQKTASDGANRALARGVHGGPGGWPLAGAAPPCVRKFCILQAKYAYFQALRGLNLQKYMIWGLQGGS